MIYKKIIAICLVIIITLLWLIPLSGCSSGKLSVIDKYGKAVAELRQLEISDDVPYKPYLEFVVEEAIDVIANINNCSFDNAKKILLKNDLIIETCFDTKIYEAIKKSYVNSDLDNTPFGCAVTDLNGGLCAVYSYDSNKSTNYANTTLSPYSTLKPLSVYAPAIENNIANWSTIYEDSPYKQIKDEDGNFVDWPENATGVYSNENTTVCQAIKDSLNTISVKCLDDYGVMNSIDFLRKKLNINLNFEYSKAIVDENEVIGNLAMGYLYEGISPTDMAGYYQIFANGGEYREPKSIISITDKSGNILYEHNDKPKRIISTSTAYIMNKLLQETVKPGGTGENAKIHDVDVGGKTGTGTANDCHWFVGFVPQYSCSVWHGGSSNINYSPEIFKDIMSQVNLDKSIEFPFCTDVCQSIYCCESGLLCTENCRRIDMGYYFADDDVDVCKIHN